MKRLSHVNFESPVRLNQLGTGERKTEVVQDKWYVDHPLTSTPSSTPEGNPPMILSTVTPLAHWRPRVLLNEGFESRGSQFNESSLALSGDSEGGS